jgi:NADH-quinone oxidoreductase subunit C
MGDLDLELCRALFRDLDVEVTQTSQGVPRLDAAPANVVALLRKLRDDPETSMRRLVDLTAIDRGGSPRFELVYRVHAPGSNERVEVHVAVPDGEAVLDSVIAIWPAAGWLEREVFDLFGIPFRGHPELRRILLSDDFEGAPLRKDYPRQPGLGLPKEVDL